MTQGIESRLATRGGITFTVNTALDSVPLVLTGAPSLLVNAGVKYLPYGENCIIKGFCLSHPYQFGQGPIDQGSNEPMFVQLGWRDSAGNNGTIQQVDTGLFNIPDPNVWYDTDIFIPQPAAVTNKWFFEIIGLGGEVSMFNVPADLNTDVLDSCFHLKILHTLALTA